MDVVLSRGTILGGRYRLERPLGSGGMSAVWVAWQIALEREVAVKVLLDTAAEHRPRLRREALALAAVHHPAIVQVYDYDETEDGAPFVVMELLRGESLASHLAKHGAMPADRAVELVLPLLDGLAVAHRAGIIHRDVKPDNIILTRGSSGVAPKLLDFGIASVARDEARVTRAGGLVGTPAYMAPEQIERRAPDERADVWGAAATLYEIIAGAPPFGAEDIFAVMRRVLTDPPPYPRNAAGLDGRLWAILMDGLRKDPAARTPSVSALRDALAAWLAARGAPAGAVLAPPSAPADPRESARFAPTLPAGMEALPNDLHKPSANAKGDLPRPSEDAPPSIDALIRGKLGG
jgi:serine/threonine protein kinase